MDGRDPVVVIVPVDRDAVFVGDEMDMVPVDSEVSAELIVLLIVGPVDG